ncbi:cell wall-active antibiotics response protein LiaF [Paenibacillus roseipurpureus]|uniref:Cell wall-active antibiotics response protein LiaF n=1 Tax=Paenibacillus roseopurpureus TaxID=2918901 RepID=A0AA96LN23_9BACL|nr:cell wall-active antibiotics response protein LiaF [Paenibacillus sp. MBLB1832]WNR43556.1 cell wall-active antibiotics response protein LiaF [Paenibacillus sp. MBLB1832]
MNPHMFQRMIWGLVLVSAGTLFLLNQLGVIHVDVAYMFSTYWPVILIFYGVVGFLSQRRHHWGGSIWSLILCGVGTIFLLKNLSVTDLSIGEMFKFLVPVTLILLGLNVIFRPSKKESPEWSNLQKARHEMRMARREERREMHRMRHENHKRHWESGAWQTSKPSSNPVNNDDPSSQATKVNYGLTDEEKEVLKDIHGKYPEDHELHWKKEEQANDKCDDSHKHKYDGFVHNYNPGDVLHRHGFIGDVHLGQEAWELKPIQISHFIGDSVIDLTRAAIPRGETSIHVTAFIGDVKIFIPNDMDVEVRVMASSFIGDMKVLDRRESGFLRSVRTQTSHYEEAEHKIVVTTSMFIGDITIKKIG